MEKQQLEIENRIREILTEVFKDLIINTKQTFDLFLKEKNTSDLIALYDFYYYTAKWQKTNQPKATIRYVMKGLKWGEKKTRDRKQQLVRLGLIEDIRQVNKKGQAIGWYVKINYIWGENTILDKVKTTLAIPATLAEKPQGGQNHRVDSEGINALSVNSLNALSDNNIAEQSSAEGIPSKEKEAEGGTPPKEPPKYDFKDSLDKMEKDSRRHINIIALYWKFKGIAPENKQQYEALLKRELRPAQNLVGFSDDRILEVMDWLEVENDFKFSLETVMKFITEDLGSIAPIKAKKYRY